MASFPERKMSSSYDNKTGAAWLQHARPENKIWRTPEVTTANRYLRESTVGSSIQHVSQHLVPDYLATGITCVCLVALTGEQMMAG